MDNTTMITIVSVHSPLIQFSSSGSYYTSYAISLKSNDPCFNQAYSQVRRRYSEFLHLRRLLESHYPTIKPPPLPPKSFFYRFSDSLIEERKTGLQNFLERVLSTPVYLSDKSLHLFLQSSSSMNQIDEECIGDIPAPELMDFKSDASILSDNSSSRSCSSEITQVTLYKDGEIISDVTLGMHSGKHQSCGPSEKISQSLPNMLNPSATPLTIPKRHGSLDSSPASSVSSLDTGYCSSSEFNRRRVSFNENVTVAVVYNQLWNIGTKPIRTDA